MPVRPTRKEPAIAVVTRSYGKAPAAKHRCTPVQSVQSFAKSGRRLPFRSATLHHRAPEEKTASSQVTNRERKQRRSYLLGQRWVVTAAIWRRFLATRPAAVRTRIGYLGKTHKTRREGCQRLYIRASFAARARALGHVRCPRRLHRSSPSQPKAADSPTWIADRMWKSAPQELRDGLPRLVRC